jgi:hypothetical protein
VDFPFLVYEAPKPRPRRPVAVPGDLHVDKKGRGKKGQQQHSELNPATVSLDGPHGLVYMV